MACLGEEVQVPIIGKNEIAARVQEVLDECWDGFFPMDLEKICDYLGIAIVPVEGLKEKFGVDAYVAADFRTMYVDGAGYRDESSRYRFSVAHELGHLVLHREYFSSRIWNFEEWWGITSGGASGALEFQANYFAGSLLAPEDELLRALNVGFDGSLARNYYRTRREEVEGVLASMQRFFRVSEQVIYRRMRDTVYGWTIN